MSRDYEPHTVKSKLLPCPFCGEELVEQSDHHGTWMAHRNEPADCECGVTQIFNEKDAARWNTRSEQSAAGLRSHLKWALGEIMHHLHCEATGGNRCSCGEHEKFNAAVEALGASGDGKELEFPDGLPPVPGIRPGFRYAYRGLAWEAYDVEFIYISANGSPKEWRKSPGSIACGDEDCHYAEAVKETQPPAGRAGA